MDGSRGPHVDHNAAAAACRTVELCEGDLKLRLSAASVDARALAADRMGG